jgi:hypothetical protein
MSKACILCKMSWKDCYSPCEKRRDELVIDYIQRYINWSAEAFGWGAKTEGICKHIEKEVNEIREAPKDLMEWIDVIILGIDGAWRAGNSADSIWEALKAKQRINQGRKWPTNIPNNEPIEHIRGE